MPGPLEFMFEVDAKIDGMVKMLGAIEDSVVKLHALDRATMKGEQDIQKISRASDKAADAHKKHASAVINVGHAFEEAKEKAHGLLEAMGLLLVFEGIEKVAEKVKELGSEIIHAAAGAERFDKSFSLLLGDEGGKEVLEWIDRIAKYTEFTDDKLKMLAGSLLQVGLRGRDLRRGIEAALDISALPGGNIDAAAATIERVTRTGHVDNRALGGLGFGENDFFSRLAERTGKGREQLKKEMDAGKLDTKQAREALYDLIHKRTDKDLGSAGVDMSKTLGARLVHLKDLPEQYFEGIAKTKGYETFSKTIETLLEKLDPESAAGKRIFDGLDRAFKAFADTLAKVDVEKFSKTLIDLFTNLPPLIEATTKAIIALGKATAGWVNSPSKATHGHAELLPTPGFKVSSDSLKFTPPPVAAKPNWLDRLMGFTDADFERFRRNEAEQFGKSDAAGYAKGVKSGTPTAVQAIKGMGDETTKALKDQHEQHSPSRLFARIAGFDVEGYITGLEANAAKIANATEQTFTTKVTGQTPGPGGGGPIQVTLNVTTNVSMAGGAQGSVQEIGEMVAQSVAAQVEQILPGKLQSAFEKMAVEAGV